MVGAGLVRLWRFAEAIWKPPEDRTHDLPANLIVRVWEGWLCQLFLASKLLMLCGLWRVSGFWGLDLRILLRFLRDLFCGGAIGVGPFETHVSEARHGAPTLAAVFRRGPPAQANLRWVSQRIYYLCMLLGLVALPGLEPGLSALRGRKQGFWRT